MSSSASDYYSVGIDVGGTKIAFGLFDAEHRILARDRIPTPQDLEAEPLLRMIAARTLSLLAEQSIEKSRVKGVGIGFPSMMDLASGYIILTSAIVKLRDIAAVSVLEEALGLPVVIGNDAHCAAIAEHRFGAGRGFKDMLYCPISTGIGSAIILDGQLRRGSFGAAGESGHSIATPGRGIHCGCGNQGCFMSYVSGWGLCEHIKNWLREGRQSLMLDLAGGDIERIDGHIFSQGIDAGDKLALEALDQMIHYMSWWLFNLYITFNVNCFVFGGGMAKLGGKLFKPVREQFDRYLVAQPLGEIHFKMAELGDDFGIIGAEQLLFL